MSQLPKEWERVRSQLLDGIDNPAYRVGVENTVERCYALANKPVRGLTDDEIDAVGEPYGYFKCADAQGDVRYAFARAILAAHQRKQQEPETVTFRAARFKDDPARIAMCCTDGSLHHFWEWLEPAQTMEVKLP